MGKCEYVFILGGWSVWWFLCYSLYFFMLEVDTNIKKKIFFLKMNYQ